MNTIVLNGSPRGKNGNSEIFVHQFLKGMTFSCEVKYICKENAQTLAGYVQTFDTIIFVLPLYIHSMPGIMMRFIEHLEPSLPSEKKFMGFILQCGFNESSQCKYAERYFCSLTKELNRTYLGTVMKSSAAGVCMMPPLVNRKLFKLLQKLGKIYEQTYNFDKSIMKKLQMPYELRGFNLKFLKFAIRIGVDKIGWRKFLRKNNALHQEFDRPFF